MSRPPGGPGGAGGGGGGGMVPMPSRPEMKFMDNRMFGGGGGEGLKSSLAPPGPGGQGIPPPLIPTPSPLIGNANYMQQVGF